MSKMYLVIQYKKPTAPVRENPVSATEYEQKHLQSASL